MHLGGVYLRLEWQTSKRPPGIDAVIASEAEGNVTTFIVEARNTISPRNAQGSI
jgi:hypothetical protein